MNWLNSLGVAAISGITSLFLAGVIANACVSWHHVSNREGASGYYVIFTAIGGGIAGFIIGLIAARIAAAQLGAGFGKELSAALGVVLLLAGLWALLARAFADVPPEIDGRDLILEVEFRLPTTRPFEKAPTATGDWSFRLNSLAGGTMRTYRDGEVRTNATRLEAGRWVLPAEVHLFTERGQRAIGLKQGNEDVGNFLVSLPARPGRQFLEWSDWLPRQQPDGRAWPAEKTSYRFRVQKTVPPPPPKTNEELQAEKNEKEEAEFQALAADAPIKSWMRFTEHGRPESIRAAALARIASRTNYVAELGELMMNQDADTATEAMYLIGKLPQPSAALNPLVARVGRDITQRIRKFNASTPEQDPHYEGAADADARFCAWMEAVRALREKCGGDFIPELREILELSRVREDSHAMTRDVRRIASYHLKLWANVEPLPGDPPPK